MKRVRRYYSELLLNEPSNPVAAREIPYLTALIAKRKRQRAAKQLTRSQRIQKARESRRKPSTTVAIVESEVAWSRQVEKDIDGQQYASLLPRGNSP